jgi:hypothetical protein
MLTPLPAAYGVQSQVGCNAIQPAAGIETILLPGILLVESQEGFQGEILRLRRVPDEALEEAIYPGPMLLEQGLELR